MATQIIVLKRVEEKIKKVYAYLLANWSQKAADEFYRKFEKTIDTISKQPYSGQASNKKQNIRRKLITKHNCLYYRIKNDSVIIINVMDTRANPKRNPFD